MFVFDGINKIISLTSGTDSFDVVDLYSRWKDWVALSDNAKYETAFSNSIGGNSLGSGQFVGAYFFLQNGWIIKPQELNHSLEVIGNLFPIPDTAPLFTATLGGFQVNIVMRVSSLTQAVSSGSGLSSIQDARLENIEKILEGDEVITPNSFQKREKGTNNVLLDKYVTNDGNANITITEKN